MKVEQLQELATWLEEQAAGYECTAADDDYSMAMRGTLKEYAENCRVAARCVDAMAKLEGMGTVRIDHMFPRGYEINDEPVRGKTLLEAIEAAK